MRVLKILCCILFAISTVWANEDSNSSKFVFERMLKNSHGEITKDFSESAFAIQGIHKKLNLVCSDCHKDQKQEQFSSEMKDSCLSCHKSYEKIAEATGHLGHDDNIHKSPHYESLSCDTCHKAHKPSVNMCLRCHTQDSMKNLIVK